MQPEFLQEAAVNGDLTEFVFDEHQLFVLVAFRNQLLNEGSLTRTQKAGKNIYFGHKKVPFYGDYLTV